MANVIFRCLQSRLYKDISFLLLNSTHMKHVIILIAACFMCCACYGESNNYPRLGRYKKVTITALGYRGIQIMHSTGACWITEADLSDEEKILLKKELESVKQIQVKYAKKLALQKEDAQKKQAQLELLTKQQNDALDKIIDDCQSQSAFEALQTLGRIVNKSPHDKKLAQFIVEKYPFAKDKNRVFSLINDLNKKFSQEIAEENKISREKSKQENIKKSVTHLLQLLDDVEKTMEDCDNLELDERYCRVIERHEARAMEIQAWNPDIGTPEKEFLKQILLTASYLKSGLRYLNLCSRESDIGMTREAREHLNEAKNVRKEPMSIIHCSDNA